MPPKEVSLTDPQATWVARAGLDPFFAYDANYLIDNKVGILGRQERTTVAKGPGRLRRHQPPLRDHGALVSFRPSALLKPTWNSPCPLVRQQGFFNLRLIP